MIFLMLFFFKSSVLYRLYLSYSRPLKSLVLPSAGRPASCGSLTLSYLEKVTTSFSPRSVAWSRWSRAIHANVAVENSIRAQEFARRMILILSTSP